MYRRADAVATVSRHDAAWVARRGCKRGRSDPRPAARHAVGLASRARARDPRERREDHHIRLYVWLTPPTAAAGAARRLGVRGERGPAAGRRGPAAGRRIARGAAAAPPRGAKAAKVGSAEGPRGMEEGGAARVAEPREAGSGAPGLSHRRHTACRHMRAARRPGHRFHRRLFLPQVADLPFVAHPPPPARVAPWAARTGLLYAGVAHTTATLSMRWFLHKVRLRGPYRRATLWRSRHPLPFLVLHKPGTPLAPCAAARQAG